GCRRSRKTRQLLGPARIRPVREVVRADGIRKIEQILFERKQRLDVQGRGLRGRQRRLQGDGQTLRPFDQSALLQGRQAGDVLVQRQNLERDRARIVGVEHNEVAHGRQQRTDEI